MQNEGNWSSVSGVSKGANFENAVKITVDLFVLKKHFFRPQNHSKVHVVFD